MNKHLKKAYKMIFGLIVFTIIFFGKVNILAAENQGDFFDDAFNWYQKGEENYNNLEANPMETVNSIVSKFSSYVQVIGTVIIMIATIVIGIKYMFASAEGKSVAKENLISLFVACLLFFGWSSIQSILIDGTTSFVLFQNVSGANKFNSVVGNVFTIFKFFAQIVAFIAVMYVGIKYIFAGAEGRADLKSKSFPFIIGIILAFCTVQVIDVVSKIINQTI